MGEPRRAGLRRHRLNLGALRLCGCGLAVRVGQSLWCKNLADRVETRARDGAAQDYIAVRRRRELLIRGALLLSSVIASCRYGWEFSHSLQEFRNSWNRPKSGIGPPGRRSQNRTFSAAQFW